MIRLIILLTGLFCYIGKLSPENNITLNKFKLTLYKDNTFKLSNQVCPNCYYHNKCCSNGWYSIENNILELNPKKFNSKFIFVKNELKSKDTRSKQIKYDKSMFPFNICVAEKSNYISSKKDLRQLRYEDSNKISIYKDGLTPYSFMYFDSFVYQVNIRDIGARAQLLNNNIYCTMKEEQIKFILDNQIRTFTEKHTSDTSILAEYYEI